MQPNTRGSVGSQGREGRKWQFRWKAKRTGNVWKTITHASGHIMHMAWHTLVFSLSTKSDCSAIHLEPFCIPQLGKWPFLNFAKAQMRFAFILLVTGQVKVRLAHVVKANFYRETNSLSSCSVQLKFVQFKNITMINPFMRGLVHLISLSNKQWLVPAYC